MTRTASAYQQREDNRVAVQVTADLHRLPLGRLEPRTDRVHVFTADLGDLDLWQDVMGGHITSQETTNGVVLRTLHTHADPGPAGTGVPVLVSVLTTDHYPTNPKRTSP